MVARHPKTLLPGWRSTAGDLPTAWQNTTTSHRSETFLRPVFAAPPATERGAKARAPWSERDAAPAVTASAKARPRWMRHRPPTADWQQPHGTSRARESHR